MLSRSISATHALPMAHAAARTLTISAISKRRSARTSLESLRPLMRSGSVATTQAATTGPASGPRPTSSTPPTKRKPLARAATSNWCRRCNRRRSRSYAFLLLRCFGVIETLQRKTSEGAVVKRAHVGRRRIMIVDFGATPHEAACGGKRMEIRNRATMLEHRPLMECSDDFLGVVALCRYAVAERELPLRLPGRNLRRQHAG